LERSRTSEYRTEISQDSKRSNTQLTFLATSSSKKNASSLDRVLTQVSWHRRGQWDYRWHTDIDLLRRRGQQLQTAPLVLKKKACKSCCQHESQGLKAEMSGL